MTDEELKELVAGLAVAQAKTDVQQAETAAQQAKTDAQLAKTDAKLNRLAEMYGGVGNNQGAVTEEFYFNSLKDHPVLGGIHFDAVYKNLSGAKDGVQDEFDIVLANGQDVFLIEVKYKAHKADLDRLLKKKAPNFRKLFPLYGNYRHHLGLASFHFNDDLIGQALSEGVTVLQRKGDVVETRMPESK